MDYDQVLDTLADGLKKAVAEQRLKHDIPGSISVSTNMMHGLSGIFGYPGISQDVFATRVKPRGLLEVLPARGNMQEQPIVAYLTGFTDDENAAEKDGVCDDPLAAGEIKNCLQGALYGRVERKTKTLELNSLGRSVNRGEFFDLRLVNDPLLDGNLLSMPGNVPQEFASIINNEVMARWMTLGVAFERKLGPLVYTGTPANNTAGGGYKEFHGLETLVGTGKIDVITATACAALDSDVRNFAYARVDTAPTRLYNMLISMFRNLQYIASSTGLDPVTWVMVMRRSLFDEIVDFWPLVYATFRFGAEAVTSSAITNLNIDAARARMEAEDMRTGKYLVIDGQRVRVVVDDFIPEESNTTSASVVSGCFASDIYILPLTVRGGIVSTFFEYIDFNSSMGAMAGARSGRVSDEYWTDGGRFLWTTNRTLWCIEWVSKIEPRLRLLTPHLAGRIQNVSYCPVKPYRSDDPNSAYFADGGEIIRSNAPYSAGDFPAALQLQFEPAKRGIAIPLFLFYTINKGQGRSRTRGNLYLLPFTPQRILREV